LFFDTLYSFFFFFLLPLSSFENEIFSSRCQTLLFSSLLSDCSDFCFWSVSHILSFSFTEFPTFITAIVTTIKPTIKTTSFSPKSRAYFQSLSAAIKNPFGTTFRAAFISTDVTTFQCADWPAYWPTISITYNSAFIYSFAAANFTAFSLANRSTFWSTFE
jgi:hypothetical protein